MEYKKIAEKGYNLHIIKNKKSKKIKIKINFKEKLTKENIVYRNMLSIILLESNKFYKTKRLLDIKCEDLYYVAVNSQASFIGNYNILSFDTVFLNEIHTEKGLNNESIKFFFELITEPNIEYSEFNKETFKIAKTLLKEDIESFNDFPNKVAFNSFHKSILKGTNQDLVGVGYMEDLEKMTEKSLYKYYQKIIKDNIIDIFVIGNFDSDEMEKTIKGNLKFNKNPKESESHFLKHTKTRKIVKKIVEEKDIQQSILLIGSKLLNITDFERLYVLSIYNMILGGSPDSLLFKSVREKNSLCYSISSAYSATSNIQIVNAGIDKSNFNKTVTLIKKEIKKMENGEFTEKQIEQAKTSYIEALKEIEDTQSGMISLYEGHTYLGFDLIKERAEKIKKVTKEDIIKVSKKMYMDTIYLLKGVKTNEEE